MELARDMREEYRHVLEDLGLADLSNLSLKTRQQLCILKQKIALLLLAKVGGYAFHYVNLIARNAKQIITCSLFPKSLSNDGQPKRRSQR